MEEIIERERDTKKKSPVLNWQTIFTYGTAYACVVDDVFDRKKIEKKTISTKKSIPYGRHKKKVTPGNGRSPKTFSPSFKFLFLPYKDQKASRPKME